MALSDYAHWNEDAYFMWWQEEGRHPEEAPEDYDDHTGQYDADYEEDEPVTCWACEEPLKDGQETKEIRTEVGGVLVMVLVHKECQP